ncbi:MAG: hypothetical protein AAF485_08150 [Chloroflexota bacterium]
MKQRSLFYVLIGVTLLLSVIVIGVLLAASLLRSARPHLAEPFEVSADTPPTFALGQFRRIGETSYLIASVSARPDGSRGSFISSGYDSSETRNLVFLHSDTLESHRLFETSEDQVILTRWEYPDTSSGVDGSQPVDELLFIEWLVYRVVIKDTNDDGRLDHDDESLIAISDVDGGNYVEVLEGVRGLNGMTMIDEAHLLIAYLTDEDDRKVVLVDLANRTITKQDDIVDLTETE